MLSFPNAKINLGLNIIEKRSDGYHNLETAFLPISLTDVLEIVPDPPLKETQLHISGMPVEGEISSNLCIKAYRLLQKKYALKPVRILLHKIIPSGGGLGGGSADGAFTLKLLNDLFELNIKNEELLELSLLLGSDCPFFIKNKPSFAEGRGEKLSELSLSIKNLHIAIAFPPIKISTAQAFQGIEPSVPANSIRNIVQGPISEWKHHLHNDFENTVFPIYPELKEIKDAFYKEGAIYASLTGTGSCIYGIFSEEIKLNRVKVPVKWCKSIIEA